MKNKMTIKQLLFLKIRLKKIKRRTRKKANKRIWKTKMLIKRMMERTPLRYPIRKRKKTIRLINILIGKLGTMMVYITHSRLIANNLITTTTSR